MGGTTKHLTAVIKGKVEKNESLAGKITVTAAAIMHLTMPYIAVNTILYIQ